MRIYLWTALMLAVLGGLWRERGKQKWRNFRLVLGENWGDSKRGSSLVPCDSKRLDLETLLVPAGQAAGGQHEEHQVLRRSETPQ